MRFNKIVKSDSKLRHVCLSVFLPAWNNSAPTGKIFVKGDIWILKKIFEKIQYSLKANKNIRYFTWRPVQLWHLAHLFLYWEMFQQKVWRYSNLIF